MSHIPYPIFPISQTPNFPQVGRGAGSTRRARGGRRVACGAPIGLLRRKPRRAGDSRHAARARGGGRVGITARARGALPHPCEPRLCGAQRSAQPYPRRVARSAARARGVGRHDERRRGANRAARLGRRVHGGGAARLCARAPPDPRRDRPMPLGRRGDRALPPGGGQGAACARPPAARHLGNLRRLNCGGAAGMSHGR